MDMYDKYKISQLILHIHIYKMKINIQQGSQIQYIYITVSLLVDSSGWSFDSKLFLTIQKIVNRVPVV